MNDLTPKEKINELRRFKINFRIFYISLLIAAVSFFIPIALFNEGILFISLAICLLSFLYFYWKMIVVEIKLGRILIFLASIILLRITTVFFYYLAYKPYLQNKRKLADILGSSRLKRTRKKELKGLGGWLIFWIIYSIFIILMLAMDFSERPTGSLGVNQIMELVFLVILALVFVFLFRKSRFFPRIVQGYLLLNIIVLTVSSIKNLYGMPVRADGVENLLNYAALIANAFLIGPIGSLLWLLYFRKSKRVKNTFVR